MWGGGRGDSRLGVTYLFVCACVRTSAEDDKFPRVEWVGEFI